MLCKKWRQITWLQCLITRKSTRTSLKVKVPTICPWNRASWKWKSSMWKRSTRLRPRTRKASTTCLKNSKLTLTKFRRNMMKVGRHPKNSNTTTKVDSRFSRKNIRRRSMTIKSNISIRSMPSKRNSKNTPKLRKKSRKWRRKTKNSKSKRKKKCSEPRLTKRTKKQSLRKRKSRLLSCRGRDRTILTSWLSARKSSTNINLRSRIYRSQNTSLPIEPLRWSNRFNLKLSKLISKRRNFLSLKRNLKSRWRWWMTLERSLPATKQRSFTWCKTSKSRRQRRRKSTRSSSNLLRMFTRSYRPRRMRHTSMGWWHSTKTTSCQMLPTLSSVKRKTSNTLSSSIGNSDTKRERSLRSKSTPSKERTVTTRRSKRRPLKILNLSVSSTRSKKTRKC